MCNQIIFYKDRKLEFSVEVITNKETVWLRVEKISELFDRDRSVIQRHIRNIFKENDLAQNLTCANFVQVQNEGNRPNLKGEQMHLFS